MAKRTPQRLVFSKTRLEALPTPDTGRTYYYDEATDGLCLCITASGARTFYSYRKIDGRPIRYRIGKFPGITVADARDIAKNALVAQACGQDPQAAKRERREEATFGDLWGHWQTYSTGRKKPISIAQDARQYNAYLKDWATRRLSTIDRDDVASLHSRLGRENGPYQANRVLALVKSMFGKADALGFKGENPARGIEKFPEVARDRFLTPEELPAFFEALAGEPNPFIQGFFALCLLTGARRSNVLAMRWSQVSWELRQWRIPDTKGGFAVVVPLCTQAVQILEQLKGQEKRSEEWVFPSNHGAEHLKDPMPAWRRLCKRAGFVDADDKPTLHIHDLRRSLGSWQAITGASLQVIGKTLGHVRPETTAIYARLTLDPVRQSLEAAVAGIYQAKDKGANGKEATNGTTNG